MSFSGLAAEALVEVPLPKAGEDVVAVLEKVRDRVRAMPAAEKAKGVVVQLAPGVWNFRRTLAFTAADSGVEDAAIVWRGAPGRRTVLRFSDELPWTAFAPVTDAAVRARLDPAAAAAVRVADISDLPFAEPEVKKESSLAPLRIPEVYFDGERMPFARWPNSGVADAGRSEAWTTIEKILDKGGSLSTGFADDAAKMPNRSAEPRGGLFSYVGDRPSRWTKAPVVYLQGFWAFDWWEATMPVESIVTSNRTIRLKYPHVYGLKQGNPSPRRWRAVHLLEELDVPGEYCFDFAAKRLYFYPPRTMGRVSVAGRPGDFITFDSTHDVTLYDLALEEGFSSGVSARNVRRLCIENVGFRNLFDRAVSIAAGESCVIRRCDIEETGRGAISIDGGDRRTLRRGNDTVEDCLIRRYSRLQFCYANAIQVSGVGHIVRHNEIYDAPHQAVTFGCNDSVFEYNVVSNVVNCSDDAGAFYKGRNPSRRGNVLRHNFWSDIGSARGHGTAAVYFDDGDVGETVYGNVFVRCGTPGKGSFGTVFSHGGFSNVVENCLFIDCQRPLGSSPWSDQRWREYVMAPLWQTRLLKEVDITKPPYITRYPDFAGFMDPQPGQARDNLALTNVFVNCREMKSGRWVTNATDAILTGDYALTPDSPVFKAVPGFKPIPFDRIGLLTPRDGTPLRRDPSAIWNRESLYRTPKVERWQGPFDGEVTPIWIEGEPYRGRPTRCFAFYGIPKGASKENKVPGIVLVHGGAGTAYPEWVRLWVRRGYAAIAVDNCGALPVYTRSHGWMANPEGGPRGWGGFAQLNAPLEDQWTYHAVAVSMLSHSYLRSLDCVDTSTIGVTGISWGGFLTCILAAADNRFAYAVPVYGCAFNHEPGGFESRRLEALRWGALWDPSLFLPFAKCPLLWVDGTNDFAFPLGDVKRSADLVAAPQAFCTRVRMPHGHGPVGEAPAEILDFADHFARGRADIVRFTASGVKDGRFAVSFAPNGRTLVRAELLYTEDGPAVDRKVRRWQVKPADAFDAVGSAEASLSPQTSEAVLNLISAEGLIYSSPYWHR